MKFETVAAICARWQKEHKPMTTDPLNGNPQLQRFRAAYLAMASRARYRPQAPGDGFGHIDLSEEHLKNQDRLWREATEYAIRFYREEETKNFWIGYSDFMTNRAFIWTIEAARNLAAGVGGNKTAIKLLEMALQEVQAQHSKLAAKLKAEGGDIKNLGG
jgi:hypothetical protein